MAQGGEQHVKEGGKDILLIGKNTERDGHGGGEEKAVCSMDVKAAHIPTPQSISMLRLKEQHHFTEAS